MVHANEIKQLCIFVLIFDICDTLQYIILSKMASTIGNAG